MFANTFGSMQPNLKESYASKVKKPSKYKKLSKYLDKKSKEDKPKKKN